MDDHATLTNQPEHASLRVLRSGRARELRDDEWNALAVDVYSTWQMADGARGAFNQNLESWSALEEMESEEIDFPWPGAANLIVPIIPSELDQLKAALKQQVLGVQRLVVVTPADDKDSDGARLAAHYEKWINADLRRIRGDGKSKVSELGECAHLGLRDGTAVMDVLFRERSEPVIVVTEEVETEDDGQGNVTVKLGDDGLPSKARKVTRATETISEVIYEAYLLKEFWLGPEESPSKDAALALMRTVWMTEKTMKEKVKAGVFRKDKVQEVLNFLVAGVTSTGSDPDGHYDKTAGGQISIGGGQGSVVSNMFKNRGPAQLIRVFSDQYNPNEPDDEDAPAIPCIYWFFAQQPNLLLGWEEFEYATGAWPTFLFAPMPRAKRPFGFSLCERLADLTADTSAGRNQRRNYIDMSLMPVLLGRDGDQIYDKNREFMPGVRWYVENPDGPNKSLSWFVPPALPSDSFTDEGRTDVYVNRLTGQGDPQIGAPSSGRRSATESRQRAQASAVRTADMAMTYREFICAVVNYEHKLNMQYLGAASKGPTTPVSGSMDQAYGGQGIGHDMTLDPAVFMHKFNITIAGLSDPTDPQTRRAEMMAAIDVSMKAFPWIFQDPELSYAFAEQLYDTFNWGSTQRVLGTAEQATQRKQAAAAQAQAQAQQAQLGGGQPSQPGGGGQPAPGGQ